MWLWILKKKEDWSEIFGVRFICNVGCNVDDCSVFFELGIKIERIDYDCFLLMIVVCVKGCVGTKGVSQVYHLSFDDNKVLKIINWIW